MSAETVRPRFRCGDSGCSGGSQGIRGRPTCLLQRHLGGDWGDVDEHDRRENEFSVQPGWRILSSYMLTNRTRLWVITEADRSCTTFLLPAEY